MFYESLVRSNLSTSVKLVRVAKYDSNLGHMIEMPLLGRRNQGLKRVSDFVRLEVTLLTLVATCQERHLEVCPVGLVLRCTGS